MNQLFYNLLSNSLKFTKESMPPLISITTNKLTEERKKSYPQLRPDKEYYQIQFTDNGIGFSQEYAEKIFIIFQRLNERSMFGGYGIGLAICKKVVNNHLGAILADGAQGVGATFTVILPRKQEDI
jgi:signal transduction histidine kinase